MAYVKQYVIGLDRTVQREVSMELAIKLGVAGMETSINPFPSVAFWDDSMWPESVRAMRDELTAARARIAELEAVHVHA